MSLPYRPDIDGLRALAVSAVIAYHLGVSELSGGYLGVDVFFVISGYLISSIILREIQQGVFSFKQFYLRRVRRIFPALFSMMLVCWPLAYRYLLPEQFEEFSNSLIYVTLFVSNLFFAGKTGYFDTAIETKPLIHTWSLAVEEQYYLLFPVLLLLFARRSSRGLVILSLIAIVLSFSFAIWQPLGKTFAFFSVLTRTWEFFWGFLASLIVLRGQATRSVELAYLGLGLIVLAFVFADDSFSHPGWITWAPVLGCWLLIINHNNMNLAYRILTCKPVQLIGLMSYSLYLWHQPLLVFYRYQQIDAIPSNGQLLALLVILYSISWFSWRFVETPFRNRQRISNRTISWLAMAFSVLILAVGYAGQAADGFPNRFAMPESLRGQFEQKKSAQNCQPIVGSEFKVCYLGASPEQAKTTMAVFGDSHALALIPAFDKLGQQYQIQFIHIAESACPPLQGVFVRNAHTGTDFCQRLAEKQWETLKRYPNLKQVIWVAKWASYTDGNYQGGQLNWLGSEARVDSNVNMTRQVFSDALRQTAARYQNEGLKLTVLLQLPQQLQDVKQVYYRIFDQPDPSLQSTMLNKYAVPKIRHEQLQSFNRSLFNQLAAEGVLQVLNLDSRFCDETICRLGLPDQTWYRDADHVSVLGALAITEQLASAISLNSNARHSKENAKNVD